MVEAIASAIVIAAAAFLICVAAMSFFAPKLATRFLDGFASSARAHMTEMTIRLVVGWSFVVYAPRMLYSDVFSVFGWVLVVTSAMLLLIPWRWHHRFAESAVRPLTRHVWLFGTVSLPLGGVILFAVLGGGSST